MVEIYVSTDVETDGPIPGPHSMLSLGSAAFTAEGEQLGNFYATLKPIDGAQGHPNTTAWWKTQPEAWAEATAAAQPAAEVMKKYVEWLNRLEGKTVFVGYPAGFDFLFVYWYLIKFVGVSPFGFSALDIKSYAMAKLGSQWRETVKKNMPRHWFSAKKHTHNALDDAIEQGELFLRILKEK